MGENYRESKKEKSLLINLKIQQFTSTVLINELFNNWTLLSMLLADLKLSAIFVVEIDVEQSLPFTGSLIQI